MDQLLVESGLFGRGLVCIDTPQGVARYNEALIDLGLEPTGLTTFRIDGMGWSPEIALERNNNAYLGHGEANRVAIIATPDQDRKPIFLPTYSFKRSLMRNFFDRNKREIADITTTACVQLELENDILLYNSPKDLLDLQSVTVRATAGKLMALSNGQKQLAAQFMAPGAGWLDASLRSKIIATSKEHGDLRRRRTEIPDFPFSLIGNFWTRAFGGVFVLRTGADSVLVVEDKKWLPKLKPGAGERYKVFSLGQKELTEHLLEEDLLTLDMERYQEDSQAMEDLDTLEQFIMVDAVCAAEPDCDFAAMSPSKRKGILLDRIPAELSDLHSLKRALKRSDTVLPEIPPALRPLLLRPSQRAGNNAHAILRMLLLRLQENPPDVMRLYVYDKERFFSLFDTWPISKKRWVADYIATRYKAEMDKTDR